MADRKQIGRALTGAGAWFAGQGPAYMAAQASQQAAAAREKEAQAIARNQAQKGVIGRNRETRFLLERGDLGGAIRSYQGMLRMMGDAGLPMESGARTLQMLEMSRENPALAKTALMDIINTDEMAVAKGMLKPMGGEQPHSSAKSFTWDNGTSMQIRSDGSRIVIAPNGQQVEGDAAVDVLQQARNEQVAHAGAKAGATTEATGEAGRTQDVINFGYDAAKGLPIIKRSLFLMNLVDTGGIDAAKLKAKQWFGIESGDEAELSSLLGRAVLSQLRSTFGAQFTEKEGARLERIEANIGKSTAGNIRILRQLETMSNKYINNALKRATATEDWDTVNELMEMKEFTLSTPGAAATPGATGGAKFLGFE